MNAGSQKAMTEAFRAELAADYPKARRFTGPPLPSIRPTPVPTRFLGELYRHQTGEWTLATATLQSLLEMQPDPLSRAVRFMAWER